MANRYMPSLFSKDTGMHPFTQSLQREIDRAFDRFRDGGTATLEGLFGASDHQMLPALEVAETDDLVEIHAELPGVREEDLDVYITDGVLVLKGEKNADREEKEKDYHLVERRYGSFRRSIPLGFSPADDAVAARFEDGVLQITIKKPAEAARKTQKVSIAKG